MAADAMAKILLRDIRHVTLRDIRERHYEILIIKMMVATDITSAGDTPDIIELFIVISIRAMRHCLRWLCLRRLPSRCYASTLRHAVHMIRFYALMPRCFFIITPLQF